MGWVVHSVREYMAAGAAAAATRMTFTVLGWQVLEQQSQG